MCEQGTFWVTTDGGAKWTASETSAKVPLRALTFLDSKRGLAVGDQGFILATDDSGKTWKERPSGTKEKLMDVVFVGDQGWASGMNGTMIHTADGGRTWSAQTTGTSQAIEGLFFLDQEHGWAVGWAGTILLTTDSGKTWKQVKTDAAQWSLSSILFKDAKNGWAVGFAGQILRSGDGGLTWKSADTPVHGWLTSIAFDRANRGWITYDDGFLVSEDGGGTWKPVAVDGRFFLSRLLNMNDSLWALGQSAMLRLEGNGTAWKRIDSLVPNAAMREATAPQSPAVQ
jgi:photosystem II stability/assembly factor-like uncharacterized protein